MAKVVQKDMINSEMKEIMALEYGMGKCDIHVADFN